MSDFSDRPFVAGSLVGLRAFSVDGLGRLSGPSHGGVFTPDENVGECKKYSSPFALMQWELDRQLAIMSGRPPRPRPPLKPVDVSEHQVGSAGCTCGFYAYFDGGNDYAKAGRVSAVVEGYGVCTVGTRGFRAEKARLVALVLPKQRHWHSVYIKGHRINWFWLVVNLVNLVSATRHWVGGDYWMAIFSTVALLLLGFSQFFTARPKQDRSQAALIRRNYPDIPTYPTIKAALRAHPLTPPPPPTPETAEDFWIREVGA